MTLSLPVTETFTFHEHLDALAVAARFSGKAILTPR
jgi:hypothetical protein